MWITTVALYSMCIAHALSNCPDGFLRHADTCYHFSHDTETYNSAKSICHNDLSGSTLVEIETAEENAFLAAEAKRYNQYYIIALNDIAEEGVWVWGESHDKATYFNWGPGQPDNYNADENCVQLAPNGEWIDIPCHQLKNYICELRDEGPEVVG
ncbi:asialoglycoprotein receptor 2-like [Mya arenaria]|uniref:asialoglycoprotein receptor 2-like n=1 Tax=Mya arenaria TaxID=6604 RepID=UPI0022E59DED|nr:asialoglycoprotein receptor 2-like [Mya arenaria]